jgi:hypothetical protein
MAVDPAWLHKVRKKNRAQYGMSGMGGLGQGASHVADTLYEERARRSATELNQQAIEAELRAKEALASDPRTAAILALPKIEIPEARPIPKNWLIGGAVAAVALVGLIIWRSR